VQQPLLGWVGNLKSPYLSAKSVGVVIAGLLPLEQEAK
jgi:hypothetical protein